MLRIARRQLVVSSPSFLAPPTLTRAIGTAQERKRGMEAGSYARPSPPDLNLWTTTSRHNRTVEPNQSKPNQSKPTARPGKKSKAQSAVDMAGGSAYKAKAGKSKYQPAVEMAGSAYKAARATPMSKSKYKGALEPPEFAKRLITPPPSKEELSEVKPAILKDPAARLRTALKSMGIQVSSNVGALDRTRNPTSVRLDEARISMTWTDGTQKTATAVAKTQTSAMNMAALHLLALMSREGIVTEVWPLLETLDRSTTLQEKSAFIDVHNYCARYLLMPKVTMRRSAARTRRFWHCTIELEEQGISGAGTGPELHLAQLAASIKFKAAAEAHLLSRDGSSSADTAQTILTGDSAEKFHLWMDINRRDYAQPVLKYSSSKSFAEAVAISPQTEEPVSPTVAGRNKAFVAELALLHAAVAVVKADRDKTLLDQFSAALVAGKGRIIRRISPVDLVVTPGALDIMHRTIRESPQLSRADTELDAVYEPAAVASRSRTAPLDEATKQALSQSLTEMYQRYLESDSMANMRRIKAELPMNQYKQQVFELVRDNVYSIIIGATGSGKTTQVPQIVLEQYYRDGNGADCNILCTQPRRIAATSVASRVADEMGPEFKPHVGHHVRFEARLPRQGGSVTYCTTGILLQQLQAEPDKIFDHVSHLMIDEVHERDRIIDFTLTILKKAVSDRLERGLKVPRITLMSATLDTELFANYFKNEGPDGELVEAPILSVPGRTFPVTEKHLDTILAEIKSAYGEPAVLRNDKFTQDFLRIEKQFSLGTNPAEEPQGDVVIDWKAKSPHNEVDADTAQDAVIPYGLVATTIGHVLRSTTDGAVLVFFPGLDEMQRVEKLLRQSPVLGVDVQDEARYRFFLLHSSIPDSQKSVFQPVPAGVRKIILATNIAETSITIPDVQHVIDTGKVRETQYDHVKRISSLQTCWISKSNAKQRAGRAGRVQNGHYFALYTKARHQSLPAIGLPELLRSDLQTTCLSIKSSIRGVDVEEFLEAAIEPPSPVSIAEALIQLKGLGALTQNQDLTALGKLLSSLPVHPALGKMMVLGVLFRCLDPMLIIGAAVEERNLFVSAPDVKAQSMRRKIDYSMGSESDHLATYNGFSAVREHYVPGQGMAERKAQDVAFNNFIHFGAFKAIYKAAEQMEDIFVEAGLIPVEGLRSSRLFGGTALNENSKKPHIVKAILLAGMQPNIALARDPRQRLWRTAVEPTTLLPRTSVLEGKRLAVESRFVPPFVTYTSMVKSSDGNSTFLRDVSTVAPLSVLLFGSATEGEQRNVVNINDWIPLFVKTSSGPGGARTALQFKDLLERSLASAFRDLAKVKRRQSARVSQESNEFVRPKHAGLHDDAARSVVTEGVVALLDQISGGGFGGPRARIYGDRGFKDRSGDDERGGRFAPGRGGFAGGRGGGGFGGGGGGRGGFGGGGGDRGFGGGERSFGGGDRGFGGGDRGFGGGERSFGGGERSFGGGDRGGFGGGRGGGGFDRASSSNWRGGGGGGGGGGFGRGGGGGSDRGSSRGDDFFR